MKDTTMAVDQDFQYDVFLSHSAKDKAVVRPLAELCLMEGLKARKTIAQGRRSETSAALGQGTMATQAL